MKRKFHVTEIKMEEPTLRYRLAGAGIKLPFWSYESNFIVRSERGKGLLKSQVRIKEMSESEPFVKRREIAPTAKTGAFRGPRDKYSGYLFTGYMAVVVKRA